MKKNRILSLLSAGVLLFGGACTNDVLNPSGSEDNKVVDPTEGMYLRVAFDLPSAKSTRSYTTGDNSSSGGTEIGQDYENTVKSVMIVLTKYDNSYIAHTVVDSDDIETGSISEVGTSGRSYQATGKITKTDLAEYYSSEGFATDAEGRHKVNVFVFCNPTESLITYMKTVTSNTQWYDEKGKYAEEKIPSSGTGSSILTSHTGDVIWNKDHFLMSNSSIATRLFPPTLEEWDVFTTASSAFNLSGMNNFGRPNEIDNLTEKGNVYVERTAARYDFRDGALDGIDNEDETYNGFKAQTYHVVLDTDKKPLVDVMLGKMCMVNMNNEYYYLRRVSNNGQTWASMGDGQDNDYTICGPELPWYKDATGGDLGIDGNYVVDAWAIWKYPGNGLPAPDHGFAAHFSYPFFNENGVIDNIDVDNDRWYTQTISSVLNSENDMENTGSPRYKIWRYLTEGTIPGVNSQKNGVSNGIVFKGQMQPARDVDAGDNEFTAALLKALKVVPTRPDNTVPENPIYQFANHLYASWDHIRRMAISQAITNLEKIDGKWVCQLNRSLTLFNAVFGNGGFGTVTVSIQGDDAKTVDFFTTSGNVTLEDNVAQDQASPNYLHNLWDHKASAENPNPYETEAFFKFRKAVVDNNITIYQESYDEDLGGYGYYCYYYYWNRHNDNGQNGVMGPMEFAVVRNNVYKLAVTKIARLGHPRIAANDPDKPTPNTPDEKADVYLTVTCTTLPWVVRENNIEF